MMRGVINWISNGTNKLDDDLLCPFLGRLEPDCYCKNINSKNILLVLRYCISDFTHCAIYKRAQRNRMLNQ